jgi:hypothetical protein
MPMSKIRWTTHIDPQDGEPYLVPRPLVKPKKKRRPKLSELSWEQWLRRSSRAQQSSKGQRR